jgi:endonuclease/exonuclease/phosphatase family metal-dependent hydrolase
MRNLLRRATVWAAVAYPAALVVLALCLRFVGERWWLTGALLYVPRVLFGLPLVVLVPALLAQRARRLLWAQLLAACVLLFPLLGFVVPRFHAESKGPSFKILSYNVNSCAAGYDTVAESVLRSAPDIVVLQELLADARPLVALLEARYPTVEVTEQFVLATRFSLRKQTAPPAVNYLGYVNTPHVVRYELDTPLGPVAVVNLHPISPRAALSALWTGRGAAPPRESGADEWLAGGNVQTRQFELEAAVALAREERMPVVLAGDTNLPNLSPLLRVFDGYQDGFESAGWGFGYTFPSRVAWLRVDRMLASRALTFVDFEVGCGRASDHRCIIAELRRR